MMVLLVMTVGVMGLKFLGTPKFKELMGQLDQLIGQMFTVSATPPTPTPPPAPAPAPPAEGITPSATPPAPTPTPPAAAGCDCSCMPMDSDPSRQKIETPSGEDCYNHIYPDTVEECEAALVGVCASRGGGSTTSGGGDDDDDEESGNIARAFSVGGFR